MKRRDFAGLPLFGIAACMLPAAAAPPAIDINDAINMAGRQRMLSQRAAKSYMAMGQKILGDRADKVLASSMALFDRQLAELIAFAPTPEIKTTFASLQSLWSDYKLALVGNAAVKADAEAVLGLAGKVLQTANQATVQLETFSGRATSKLVNISGRQRMLSQRMAAYYLSAGWGVQASASATELIKARDEFVKAHELLTNAPQTTPTIKAELQLAQTQFTFFDLALQNLKPGAGDAPAQTNVFTTSERILQVMDGVTGMYAKLG